MGMIILMAELVIEIAFATYCVITKSNQGKLRSYLRIGAFAVFILLTLVSVIQWGSRWYLLAILLLVWAALGLWALLRKQDQVKPFQARTILFKAIATLLLVIIVLTPALIFPQYKLPPMTGKYPVTTVTYTYTDPNRIETFSKTGGNREVNVEFWFPMQSTGKFPLVVFSHGAFGMKGSNTSTFMDLASNGYVVCSIDHPYHSLYTRDSNGRTTTIDPAFLQEFMNANNGKYDEKTSFDLEQGWIKLRTADINFVLDTILAKAKDTNSGQVYQLVNNAKIGLFGHSLGGESSAQVARERQDISAVIDLDADLGGEYLTYTNGKYVINDRVYPTPILIIFTDELVRRMASIPDLSNVVASKKVLANAPQAFEIDMPGTNHMSLTDLAVISPLLVKAINSSYTMVGGYEADPYTVIEKMNSHVLRFFNVFLKNEGSFSATQN